MTRELIERLRESAEASVDGDTRIDDAVVTPGCDLCGEAADALDEALALLRRILENPDARIGGDIRAEVVAALKEWK